MAAAEAIAPATTPIVSECHDAAGWDAFVRTHPDATGYHQLAWKGILERAFGHKAVYLAATRNGAVAGVLPLVEFESRLFGRFAVSLPFVNYGGLLASDDEVARALGEHAAALRRERGWRHVELRHFSQRFPQWPSRRHKVAMWRRLPADADVLLASLDRKVRNLIRKAEKGCTVRSGGPELLEMFYDVFARNMRDLGTPVYTRRLFDEVVRTLPEDTRVFVVHVGREPAAASVTVRWRDRVEVPWASSLRAHADRAPNMLLYWAMLRDAVAQGAGVFDFGRSTPDEGTFHFKRQWGAEPRPLVWEYIGLEGPVPDRSPANPRFRAAIAAWQRLPLPITTWLGPRIVRNIP